MGTEVQDYVMDICVAYEEGYAHAEQGMASSFNTYEEKTDKYYAWYYGHTNSLTNQMMSGDEVSFTLE